MAVTECVSEDGGLKNAAKSLNPESGSPTIYNY